MKKILFVFIFFLLTFPLCGFSSNESTRKIKVIFFYSNHCGACHQVQDKILPQLKKKYKDSIIWDERETSANQKNWQALDETAKMFNQGRLSVPAIVIGTTMLTGRQEIEQALDKIIKLAIEGKEYTSIKIGLNHDKTKTALDKFHTISLWPILGSGLVDGINPCAFAVIVLFISFLTVYGYSKRAMIYVGVSYCVSVYLMYFLIGMGLFNFLYAIQGMHRLITIFSCAVSGLCFVLAGLTIWDYLRYRRNHNTDEMLLRLPDFLKKRVVSVIGSQLRDKSNANVVKLVVSACIVGQLVSLLEAVCTGQVYLPLIVYVLKTTKYWPKALGYLLLYNLMFILPLAVIFILSLAGVSSQKFTMALKKYFGVIKIFMALLFLCLGIIILTATI